MITQLNICKRCLHRWVPRVEDSKCCPRCNSPYWKLSKGERDNELKNKAKCRRKTFLAIKSGELKRKEKCENCGDESRVAHHNNYNDYKDITWLCSRCHFNIHYKQNNENCIERFGNDIIKEKDIVSFRGYNFTVLSVGNKKILLRIVE